MQDSAQNLEEQLCKGGRKELHRSVTTRDLKKERPVFRCSVSTFLQLVVACSGAPNGSVPQNICSSCKFLLAGRFGQNNMSLEIGKLWVSEVLAAERYVSETS